ncbi:threonylcarbamoyl-AMP synthase [Putridiphycobacter roseus]|uniref:L-threonylcarbamoyladenylate synthase n=1 Tax=Putridiphycobacter roseus TaxID=2219161 RepID=A0A2W1ND70_9FLAO|nr:L-threonylcarbamoyladenylate synthase [Putridiphycobacter roseus]PZE17365.1 threonylcarbamoyl-AMP synthase [Putridiphycobacter roseus]
MKNQVEQAYKVIKAGGIILYPSDTIWGIGCDPNNIAALEKINQLKKRAADKNFIVLVNAERVLNKHVKVIPDVCYDLLDYANKPLTIIYPKGQYVAPAVLGSDGSIAVRMVNETTAFSYQLIQKLGHGLISTSANISNHPYPKSFQDIDEEIKKGVDFIVDPSFEKTNSAPSQIIKIGENGEINILRK